MRLLGLATLVSITSVTTFSKNVCKPSDYLNLIDLTTENTCPSSCNKNTSPLEDTYKVIFKKVRLFFSHFLVILRIISSYF